MAAVIKRAVPKARLKSRIISLHVFPTALLLAEPNIHGFSIEAPSTTYSEARYFATLGKPTDCDGMHSKVGSQLTGSYQFRV
jgi:hypothetical protein